MIFFHTYYEQNANLRPFVIAVYKDPGRMVNFFSANIMTFVLFSLTLSDTITN